LAIGDMNKSLGESYEGTAAIVATSRQNMNVTPWVTGSSAEHVNFFFQCMKAWKLWFAWKSLLHVIAISSKR